MKSSPAASQINPDQMTFERPWPPLATFFVVVPSLILLLLLITMPRSDFPLPLMLMLGVVGLSCVFWIKEAIGQIGTITLEMTPEELKVVRMLGGDSYSWSMIESVKVVDPGASLGDAGRHEEGRAGIGLYMKLPPKVERAPDALPDVIIVSGGADTAEQVLKAGERITAYHRRMAAGERPRQPGTGFNKSKKAFRKPAAA